jgi:hypothetical protein
MPAGSALRVSVVLPLEQALHVLPSLVLRPVLVVKRERSAADLITTSRRTCAAYDAGELTPAPMAFELPPVRSRTRTAIRELFLLLFGLQRARGESWPMPVSAEYAAKRARIFNGRTGEIDKRAAHKAIRDLIAEGGIVVATKLAPRNGMKYGTHCYVPGPALRLLPEAELVPAVEPAVQTGVERPVAPDVLRDPEELLEAPHDPVVVAAIGADAVVDREDGLAAAARDTRTASGADDGTTPGGARRGLHEADSTARSGDVLPAEDAPESREHGSSDPGSEDEGLGALFNFQRELVSGIPCAYREDD